MAVFDIKTFLSMSARAPNGVRGLATSIGTSFGFPSCLLNLTQDLLNLIPSKILNGVSKDAKNGRDRADDVIKGVISKVRWLNGIIEFDTDEGIFKFISDTSEDGMDRDEGEESNNLGGFLNGIATAAQFAGRMYQNIQSGINQINNIRECFKSYKDYLDHSGGNGAKKREELFNLDPEEYKRTVEAAYEVDRQNVDNAIRFIEKADSLIDSIAKTLLDRQLNPSLEPVFTSDYIDALSGTTLFIAMPDTYNTIRSVYGRDASGMQAGMESEVFRLVYGPPKSKTGQFVFSKDGLYYDSQVSGLYPALLELNVRNKQIDPGDRWKFEQDPNLGGRGKGFSTKDLNLYFNTILDPNIIDNSVSLQAYYNKDGYLQDLIGERNKRIYDLSAQITQLEVNSQPQSVIYNHKQALISENANHQEKINKRKKQIELAIKIPGIYKNKILYNPGEVPLNDFSYLEGLNISLDIQKQKSIVITQDDVRGSVLPITAPTYVIAPEHSKNTVIDHLILTDIGEGAILREGNTVNSVSAQTYEITDEVVNDSLYAMYNFLETNIETPSSTANLLRNYASETNLGYGQLVANNIQDVFSKGLGIAYLSGITRHSTTDARYPSALGSYVKLPDEADFNDLLYHKNGATIDFWVHLPKFNDPDAGFGGGTNVSGLYRLILANENVGVTGNLSSSTNDDAKFFNFSDNVVNGFVMGFTRDRRLVSSEAPSNDSSLNPSSNISFFLAPTQSLSVSSAGFINRNFKDYLNCNSGTTYHCMVQNIYDRFNGNAYSACGNTFCHISVTFDPNNDQVRFYLDGVNTTTSSLSNIFGVEPYEMPKIPSFKKGNSFEYKSTTVGSLAPNSLKSGPKLNTYFTPWIVGGGYTDGMSQYGNFMGGKYGGIISGLKGYLGSFKLYKKPLSSDEVATNYRAQKEFFKNIDTLLL